MGKEGETTHDGVFPGHDLQRAEQEVSKPLQPIDTSFEMKEIAQMIVDWRAEWNNHSHTDVVDVDVAQDRYWLYFLANKIDDYMQNSLIGQLQEQIERLSKSIMRDWQPEMRPDEGAVDTAIRILDRLAQQVVLGKEFNRQFQDVKSVMTYGEFMSWVARLADAHCKKEEKHA